MSPGMVSMKGMKMPEEMQKKMPKEDFRGIKADNLADLNQIIEEVSQKKVIYVGEQHDQYGHHKVQFEFVKGLHERGGKVAVAMEMFQRPYQKYLDQYLNDEIDEKTFLEKTEYFTRWGFNYHFYRPIINYCKENHLPIVAMNVRKELSRKVARKGVDSLTADEKASIPQHLDLTNKQYEKRLRKIFAAHAPGAIMGFDNFYQSQVLWDETMAESIHNFLVKNPDHQVVVIVGSGHLLYGHGIPSRVFRHGGYDQSIVISYMGQTPTEDMADYLMFPPEIPAPFTYKLGVYLKVVDEGILITKVIPDKVGFASGLRSGDIIVKMEGQEMKTVADLKLELIFKQETDAVSMEVIRPRWLLPDKKIEVVVKANEKVKGM